MTQHDAVQRFAWGTEYLTGIAMVDDQHRQLVHLINAFSDLVTEDAAPEAPLMAAVLSDLADYAGYHFHQEAAICEAAGIDPRHAAQHRSEHAGFLEEVQRRQATLDARNADEAKSLLSFLCHWLTYHILGSDQFMARQMRAIQAGKDPQTAFQDEQRRADPATDTLLRALSELFEEVSARNRALVDLNCSLESKVAERTLELQQANQRLHAIAMTDALTGLPNRRHAMIELSAAWSNATDEDQPLCCMMIDADGFKTINDTAGHDAGDGVLRRLARELRNTIRTDDMVARLGGDEFFVVCPRTSLEGALILAESLRSAVARLNVSAGSTTWHGSISIGVAARNSRMTGSEFLIRAADEAVYVAKRRGRNCVASNPEPAGHES